MNAATPLMKARALLDRSVPTSSRTADKFVVRLPDQMREQIKDIAKDNHRSMNSQIIDTLDMHIRLVDMGHGPLLENLLRGRPVSGVVSAAAQQVERVRVGEPAIFESAVWIVEKFEVRSNLVYAVISRENPANSMPQSKSVRLSSLTAYTE